MNFVKMHGLGNDFIIINMLEDNKVYDFSLLAQKMCNRNFGIGADGIILILSSKSADIKMRIFNSDGSEAEMCGNGIRCYAKYVFENKIVEKQTISVETKAGLIIPEIILNEKDEVSLVKVDMGEPQLEREKIPMLGPVGKVIKEKIKVQERDFTITAVSMGNPHCIIFVPNVDSINIREWGPLIETLKIFPEKTNVHFVQVINTEEVILRVWERGAGVTMACGTGACATLVASYLNGLTGRKAKVKLPGGDLLINWEENNHVYMTGPAVEVYQGNFQESKIY